MWMKGEVNLLGFLFYLLFTPSPLFYKEVEKQKTQNKKLIGNIYS